MQEGKYKRLEIECELCKTKFEIWILEVSYSAEMEEKLRKNFYNHCPVCKTLQEMREKRKMAKG